MTNTLCARCDSHLARSGVAVTVTSRRVKRPAFYPRLDARLDAAPEAALARPTPAAAPRRKWDWQKATLVYRAEDLDLVGPCPTNATPVRSRRRSMSYKPKRASITRTAATPPPPRQTTASSRLSLAKYCVSKAGQTQEEMMVGYRQLMQDQLIERIRNHFNCNCRLGRQPFTPASLTRHLKAKHGVDKAKPQLATYCPGCLLFVSEFPNHLCATRGRASRAVSAKCPKCSQRFANPLLSSHIWLDCADHQPPPRLASADSGGGLQPRAKKRRISAAAPLSAAVAPLSAAAAPLSAPSHR